MFTAVVSQGPKPKIERSPEAEPHTRRDRGKKSRMNLNRRIEEQGERAREAAKKAKLQPVPSASEHWEQQLARVKGKPRETFGNAVIALRGKYGTRLRWNLFASVAEFDGRPWSDTTARTVAEKLHNDHGLYVSLGLVHESALLVAEENKFDPLVDYLKGLRWDGVHRAET